MKICFICDEYPPVSHGGIGTVTRSISEELVRLGHEVFIVGLTPNSFGGNDYEEINGVKIWRVRHGIKLIFISNKNLIYRLINKVFKLDFIGFSKAWDAHLRLIEELVKKQGIDIIEFPDYRLAFEKSKFKNLDWPNISIPKVVKFHGSINYFNYETNKKPDPNVCINEEILYDYADNYLSVSNYTKNRMIQYYNLKKPVCVIHNGLELVESKNNNEKDFVLFSGSLLEKKGIIPLLKSWNIVCNSNEKTILKLYGKGVKEKYMSYIHPKNIHRVKFMGHISKDTLLTELSFAKLAIFPSFAEAFALAPMESMMMGCPTIYSNTTSGDELAIENNALLLIDPRDEQKMAETILNLLRDNILRETLSNNGKKLIKDHFNINIVAEKHLEYYKKVIEN